jgi:transcriptional regulator with XRE-family HTH domain
MPAKRRQAVDSPAQKLGEYLMHARVAKKMTLREVEEATGRTVSNAYLSQLENSHIGKPSPNILHALAGVYGVPYDVLMEKAGYLMAKTDRAEGEKHGRVATFADKNLTPVEEEELLKHLAYIRWKTGKK